MEKLRDLRKKARKTLHEVSSDLNISLSALGSYERGTREPDFSLLNKLADYYGVTIDYLLGHGTTKIKVIGDVMAGIPKEAIETFDEDAEWEEIDGSPLDFFALRITGDSMAPRMLDGDVVIVRKQPNVENGDIAVVLIGDEATCKKVRFTPGGLHLLGLNPNFEPLFYSADDCENIPVRILGKVVELRGKM